MLNPLYSLDEDGDGLAGPWEMHDWIIWVDNIFYQVGLFGPSLLLHKIRTESHKCYVMHMSTDAF